MMHKPGTIAYIAEKWQPFTEDMTGHSAEICAWALEQEAKFLRSDRDTPVSLGAGLKYVFPVIRRSMTTLTAGQAILTANISQSVIREVVAESFEVVHDSVVELGKSALEIQGNILDHELVIALSDRISGYIESFPG